MKCTYCRYDNDADSKFCINCGRKLHKGKIKESIEDVLFIPKKKGSHAFRNIFLVVIVVCVLGFLGLVIIGLEANSNSSSSNSGQSTESTSSTWQPFTSVEEGFTVDFPKYPTSERIPEDKTNGITYKGVQYLSSPTDTTAYLVQAIDYGIPPSQYDNKAGLEGIVNYTTGNGKDTLTSSSFSNFLGYDSVNFTYTTSEGYFGKGMAFIRDDLSNIKVYMLMVLEKDGTFYDYDKFINSFRLN